MYVSICVPAIASVHWHFTLDRYEEQWGKSPGVFPKISHLKTYYNYDTACHYTMHACKKNKTTQSVPFRFKRRLIRCFPYTFWEAGDGLSLCAMEWAESQMWLGGDGNDVEWEGAKTGQQEHMLEFHSFSVRLLSQPCKHASSATSSWANAEHVKRHTVCFCLPVPSLLRTL